MIDFLLLKSLHSLLGLTITVCDQNFSVIREYKSEKTISLFYNHYLILSNFSKTQHDFLFHYGSLGELFLVTIFNNIILSSVPGVAMLLTLYFLRKS